MPALLDQGGQVPLIPAAALPTAIHSPITCLPTQATYATTAPGIPRDRLHEVEGLGLTCPVQGANDLDTHDDALTSVIVSHPESYEEQIIAPCVEETTWVATIRLKFKRIACTWLNICDSSMKSSGQICLDLSHGAQERIANDIHTASSDYWQSGTSDPTEWSEEERERREIPQYVFDYAPLIHLFSGEDYWPCDIAEHLIHTTPHLNYTPLQSKSDHPSLTDLSNLNRWGRFVYLESDDNVEDYPNWLGGQKNIPTSPELSSDDAYADQTWEEWDDMDLEGFESDEEILQWFHANEPNGPHDRPRPHVNDEGQTPENEQGRKPKRFHGKRAVGGRSDAPAVLVVVPKPDGIVDAFWFFFYSYNLGNTVFNIRFGNHVGDWEHTLVRFHDGKPKAVFFSEHNFGEAYAYDALEKIDQRPVGYSATGTHAMYARAGEHPYVLPNGILKDRTDRGPLWDPTLNLHAFTYNYLNDTLWASTQTPNAPVDWFYFGGHWGDKIYPISDPRQYAFLGQYHYVTGPLGPRFKNLGRKAVCQGNDRCIIKHWISGKEVRKWRGVGEGEEMDEADVCALYPEECDAA